MMPPASITFRRVAHTVPNVSQAESVNELSLIPSRGSCYCNRGQGLGRRVPSTLAVTAWLRWCLLSYCHYVESGHGQNVSCLRQTRRHGSVGMSLLRVDTTLSVATLTRRRA